MSGSKVRVWMHRSVVTKAAQHQLRPRLNLLLQQFLASGKPTSVKGCNGNGNEGWLRTGFRKFDFYLWWIRGSSRQMRELISDGREGVLATDVVLREVRGHDDHSAQSFGRFPEDYTLCEVDEVRTALATMSPWTEQQRNFFASNDFYSILVGPPGSGKTTALWQAVAQRPWKNILYVTWSRDLRDGAQEFFDVFAPDEMKVRCIDFHSLVDAITGFNTERISIRESLARWTALVEAHHKETSPIRFAEVRGMLIGRSREIITPKGGWLSQQKYAELSLRRSSKAQDYKDLVTDLKFVVDSDQGLTHVFGDLDAAGSARQRVETDLPDEFSEYDAIVVDEVQDLTMVEASLLVSLVKAICAKRASPPSLLIAGDEGQTTRPSGFLWGALKGLVGDEGRLGDTSYAKPAEFMLDENLRSVPEVAQIVCAVDGLYATLPSDLKPRKAAPPVITEAADSENFAVFDVRTEGRTPAEVVEKFKNHDDVLILAILDETFDAIPPSLQSRIRTPGDVKGLEYPAVLILDAKQAVEAHRDADLPPFVVRDVIDRLRVAVSRATEHLALFDAPAELMKVVEAGRIGNEADFERMVAQVDESVSDRLRRLVQEAGALMDRDSVRGWSVIERAIKLREANADSLDEDACRALTERVERSVGRIFVDGVPAQLDGSELTETLCHAIAESCASQELADQVAEVLRGWNFKFKSDPLPLLRCMDLVAQTESALAREWRGSIQLRNALQFIPTTSEGASLLDERLPGWISFITDGKLGDEAKLVRDYRLQGVDTLCKLGDAANARRINALIEPADDLRTARVLELDRSTWREAAEAYVRAAKDDVTLFSDAARLLRQLGDFDAVASLFEMAALRAEQLGNWKEAAASHASAAEVFFRLGRAEDALRAALRASLDGGRLAPAAGLQMRALEAIGRFEEACDIAFRRQDFANALRLADLIPEAERSPEMMVRVLSECWPKPVSGFQPANATAAQRIEFDRAASAENKRRKTLHAIRIIDFHKQMILEAERDADEHKAMRSWQAIYDTYTEKLQRFDYAYAVAVEMPRNWKDAKAVQGYCLAHVYRANHEQTVAKAQVEMLFVNPAGVFQEYDRYFRNNSRSMAPSARAAAAREAYAAARDWFLIELEAAASLSWSRRVESAQWHEERSAHCKREHAAPKAFHGIAKAALETDRAVQPTRFRNDAERLAWQKAQQKRAASKLATPDAAETVALAARSELERRFQRVKRAAEEVARFAARLLTRPQFNRAITDLLGLIAALGASTCIEAVEQVARNTRTDERRANRKDSTDLPLTPEDFCATIVDEARRRGYAALLVTGFAKRLVSAEERERLEPIAAIEREFMSMLEPCDAAGSELSSPDARAEFAQRTKVLVKAYSKQDDKGFRDLLNATAKALGKASLPFRATLTDLRLELPMPAVAESPAAAAE